MVAIIDQNANLVERISYDAYGTARHHHPGDLTGDGAVGQDDENAMAPLGEYGVGDISRTGVVDTDDEALVQASKAAIAPGEISTTGNTNGYAGYVFNAEHVTAETPGLYTVRHRHYEPGGGLGDASGGLGRWLSRDPIGYVDGMNLYEYVRGGPTNALDTYGLKCKPVLIAEAGGPKSRRVRDNFGIWYYNLWGDIVAWTTSGQYDLGIINRSMGAGVYGEAWAEGWVFRWHQMLGTMRRFSHSATAQAEGSVVCVRNDCGGCDAAAVGGHEFDVDDYFHAEVLIEASASGSTARFRVTTVAMFSIKGVTKGSVGIRIKGTGGGVSVESPDGARVISSTREYVFECVEE